MSKRIHALKDDRGSIAVEAAFIFPIVVLLLVMMTDTINYFSTIRTLSAAAATAGDLLASSGETVSQSELTGILSAASPSGAEAAANDGVGLIVQVYQVIDGYQVPRWEYFINTYCGAPVLDFSTLMTDGADVLIAGACVNWRPLTLSVLGMDPRAISQYSIVRPKRSARTLCSDCP